HPQTDSSDHGGAQAVGLLDHRAATHGNAPDISHHLQPDVALGTAADRVDAVEGVPELGESLEADPEIEGDPLEDGTHHVRTSVMAPDADERPASCRVPEGVERTVQIWHEVEAAVLWICRSGHVRLR